MHVTTLYSKEPVDRNLPEFKGNADSITISKDNRNIELFNDNALVLTFKNSKLQNLNKQALAKGAKSDFDTFNPHITTSYSENDLESIEPFIGDIELGPEIVADFSYEYDTCVAGPVVFTDLSFSGSEKSVRAGEVSDNAAAAACSLLEMRCFRSAEPAMSCIDLSA